MTDGVEVQHLLRERVAEEVRALLARRMMTGADLAAAIGKSPMYVSRRVRGEVAFDLDDMERLAGVFGVDVNDLLPRTTKAGAGRSSELKDGLASPAGRPLKRSDRPSDRRPVVRSRVDSVRPVSAVPLNRRRPVSVRPANRPMAS
jgi:transcriptional regulator with XRE-family HTH domain